MSPFSPRATSELVADASSNQGRVRVPRHGAHQGGYAPLSLADGRFDQPPLQVFRQEHPEFIATLEKIRRGICDEACTRFLANCGTELGKGGTIDIQARTQSMDLDPEHSLTSAITAADEPLPSPQGRR